MKKIFISLISLLVIITFIPVKVHADEQMTIISEEYPQENHNVSVEFYDELLSNICSPLPGDGLNSMIIIQYDHSDYSYLYKTITAYNVGPTVNSTFLFSIAKGQTQEKTVTKTFSGQINFNANTTLPNVIKQTINVGLGLTISGQFLKTTTTTETYVGPPTTSSYSHRDFYTGTDFDRTSVCVRRRDYYNYVNQDTGAIVDSYIETHDVIYSSIDVPKGITYSIDGN